MDALLVGGPSGTQPRVEVSWTGEDVGVEEYAGNVNEMEISGTQPHVEIPWTGEDVSREMVPGDVNELETDLQPVGEAELIGGPGDTRTRGSGWRLRVRIPNGWLGGIGMSGTDEKIDERVVEDVNER